VVGRHPDDEELRVLAVQKNNLSLSPESLAYSIETATNGAARIVYKGTSEATAGQILRVPIDDEEKSALDEAKEFIKEALDGRTMSAAQMFKDAHKAGIAPVTLKRAKSALKVRSVKVGEEWVWPAIEPDDSIQGDHKRDDEILDPLAPESAYLSEEDQGDQEDQAKGMGHSWPPSRNGSGPNGRTGGEGKQHPCQHDLPRDVCKVCNGYAKKLIEEGVAL
jgi:hypothetical protein